jgi:hypothetical protein
MDKPLYSFAPTPSGIDVTTITAGIVLCICLLGVLYFKNSDWVEVMRRRILIMIFAFIGVTAGGALAFKALAQWKLSPVKLYNNKIETPYGEVTPLSKIKDFYIKMEFSFKPLQPDRASDSTRYFYLIERGDKTHILSEADYPIDSILLTMNQLMGH